MDLSIVIPAFEESSKIARDVRAAGDFLAGNRFAGEIIVVDDGSEDDTSQIAKKTATPKDVELRVVRYEPHRGKGHAVRAGMIQTRGEFAMFADCGLCIPYGNALLGIEMIRQGRCEIAHGSRKLIESDILKEQPLHRRIASKAFKFMVRRMLNVPRHLTDTQCGFKIYKGEIARRLYAECATDGFMFDIEIILLAQKHGYRIEEFPVEWACDPDSRLSVTKTPWPVLSELRDIKRRLSQM